MTVPLDLWFIRRADGTRAIGTREEADEAVREGGEAAPFPTVEEPNDAASE